MNQVAQVVNANQARQILEDGNIDAFHKMQNHDQLMSRGEAEICFHLARTMAETVTPLKRIYSHNWLLERGLDSQLPDELKPFKQRSAKIIQKSVGISVNFHPDWDLGKFAQKKMGEKVEEMYADGDKDDALVSKEITAIRQKLIGI